MDGTSRLMVCRATVVVIFLGVFFHLAPSHSRAGTKAPDKGNWVVRSLMKMGGDVTWDREGFVTEWPDSVDIAAVAASAPVIEDDKLPDGPVAVGWLLPLAPAVGLEPTNTRVELSPSDEVKGGWEFKSAMLITQKDARLNHYPADVVFEVAEAGPGYRLELRGFKSGRAGFQIGGVLALFARGAEHQIVGEVKLSNLLITGDPSYPLTFKFTQAGYQYLYGRGRLKVGSNREYSLGEKDSVDDWTARAKSRQDWMREGAAAALGFLPRDDAERKAALSSLTVLAKDRVATVRRNAAESLGRLKDTSTLTLLEQMSTDDKDEWVKKVAAWAKSQIAKPEKETHEGVNPTN